MKDMELEKHRYLSSRLSKFDDMAKVGRKEARRLGQRFYWTGEPCLHGHIDWRHTANRRCTICQKRSIAKIRGGKRYGEMPAMREIDRHNEDARLHNELKEVWDD